MPIPLHLPPSQLVQLLLALLIFSLFACPRDLTETLYAMDTGHRSDWRESRETLLLLKYP